MKLLSVIIPLYNSSKWLPKCLDSVLSQDIPKELLEVICINDGSPDNSAQIARRYREDYPQSVVVLDQENQGPSGARNNGMRHATGKYLCFVDPDDYVEPQVFGRLVRQMEEERLDMLRFDYQIVSEDYKPIRKRDFELEFDYSPSLMSGADFMANRLDFACNIWRYCYRTDLIVKNQIWCFTGDYFDDTPWLPLVLLKAERVNVCDLVVYDYQERSDSLVKTQSRLGIKRKNEGVLLLIRLLQEEIQVLKGQASNFPNMDVLRDVSLSTLTMDKVFSWYKMMIAHSVVTFLTNTAVFEYDYRKENLEKLRTLNVFPLSAYNASLKNKKKIQLINFSPRLFVWVIYSLNKR